MSYVGRWWHDLSTEERPTGWWEATRPRGWRLHRDPMLELQGPEHSAGKALERPFQQAKARPDPTPFGKVMAVLPPCTPLGVPHVRHGTHTCEPTGAKTPLRAKPRHQAQNPPLTRLWCAGVPHVRHGTRTCETTVPKRPSGAKPRHQGRNCVVSRFGTRTCGTFWHAAVGP